MIFRFELTPQEVVQHGVSHERPVTLAEAEKGLEATEVEFRKKLIKLRSEYLSKALDIARMIRIG